MAKDRLRQLTSRFRREEIDAWGKTSRAPAHCAKPLEERSLSIQNGWQRLQPGQELTVQLDILTSHSSMTDTIEIKIPVTTEAKAQAVFDDWVRRVCLEGKPVFGKIFSIFNNNRREISQDGADLQVVRAGIRSMLQTPEEAEMESLHRERAREEERYQEQVKRAERFQVSLEDALTEASARTAAALPWMLDTGSGPVSLGRYPVPAKLRNTRYAACVELPSELDEAEMWTLSIQPHWIAHENGARSALENCLQLQGATLATLLWVIHNPRLSPEAAQQHLEIIGRLQAELFRLFPDERQHWASYMGGFGLHDPQGGGAQIAQAYAGVLNRKAGPS